VLRLRRLARKALSSWDLQDADLHFLFHGENTTFRVDFGADRFMMRLARPNYHTPGQLDSERLWLQSLCADGFGVPSPAPHRGGFRLPLSLPGVPERQILLFRWVDGRFAWKPNRQSLRRTGRLLALLHDHARRFAFGPDFDRGDWNADTLLTEENGRFRSWRHADLDNAMRSFLGEFNAALSESLRPYEAAGPRWLLHADLHRANVLHERGTANAIDFDDCGFAHPAVDIAVAMGWVGSDSYDDHWRHLCAGYAEVTADLPFTREQVYLQHLARELQMIGWLADRGRDIPAFAAKAPKLAKRCLPYFRDWLQTGATSSCAGGG